MSRFGMAYISGLFVFARRGKKNSSIMQQNRGRLKKIYKFMREEYGFFCGFLLKLEEGIAFIIEKQRDVRGIVCKFCIIYRKNGRIMRIREGAGI